MSTTLSYSSHELLKEKGFYTKGCKCQLLLVIRHYCFSMSYYLFYSSFLLFSMPFSLKTRSVSLSELFHFPCKLKPPRTFFLLPFEVQLDRPDFSLLFALFFIILSHKLFPSLIFTGFRLTGFFDCAIFSCTTHPISIPFLAPIPASNAFRIISSDPLINKITRRKQFPKVSLIT